MAKVDMISDIACLTADRDFRFRIFKSAINIPQSAIKKVL
jgi:hypothetical protein